MLSPTPRYGSWIVTLPLAAGSIAYVCFVFLPGQRTTAELRSQIGDRRETLAHAQSIGTAMAASEQEFRLARQYQEHWRRNAPRVAHLSELFAKIHRVERQSGVQTGRFDPQPVNPRNYVSEAPLVLGCTGSFASVFRLLYGLESLPAEVWVKRIRFEKKESNNEDVQCRIELVIFADN